MKFKDFKQLEKAITKQYGENRDNVVCLDNEDFKDGKLSYLGYYRLKQQCEYASIKEDIELIVPKRQEKVFKETLERIGANELSRIKQDISEARTAAAVLMFLGLIFIALGNFVEFFKGNLIKEIIIIASWVFVWAAVEKWFFDRRDLQKKKINILHILSAKITIEE